MNKAIKCGKLFNSIDGSVSENQVVLVEGERIKDVVDEQGFCQEGYEVIDLSDKFVMSARVLRSGHTAASSIFS